VGLVFAVIVEALTNGFRPEMATDGIDRWTLLENIFVLPGFLGTYGCYSPAWSISYELFYYFFYALLLFFLPKRPHRAAILGIIICIAISFPIFSVYRKLELSWPQPWSRALFLAVHPFWLGTGWFLGVLTAQHIGFLRTSRVMPRIARAWPVVLLTVFYLSNRGIIHLPLRELFLGPIFSLMIIDFFRVPPDGGSFTSSTGLARLCRVMGLASYPTYLFHVACFVLLGSAMMRMRLLWNWAALYVFLVPIGIAFGILLGFLFEGPIMAWRGRLLKKLQGSSDRIAEATVP
jgi:peptidoglycan/LPS O-acetylase OafA/YrhL